MNTYIMLLLAYAMSLTAADLIRDIVQAGSRIPTHVTLKCYDIQLEAHLNSITQVLDPNEQSYTSQALQRISMLCINQHDLTTTRIWHLDEAMELVKRGADPNIASKLGRVTLLHMMCALGNLQYIDTLINHRADPQLRDDREWDAFSYAKHFHANEEDTDILQRITALLNVSKKTTPPKTAPKTIPMRRRTMAALTNTPNA